MNTVQDLIDFINNNNWLKLLPIEWTFIELLNRNIITSYQTRAKVLAIQESIYLVRIREYNNEIYICINNIPVVAQDQANQPLTTILNHIRKNIAAYIYNEKFSH